MSINDAKLRELLHERADTTTFRPVDPGSIIRLGHATRQRRQRTRAGAVLAGLMVAAAAAVLVVGVPKSDRPASLIPAVIASQQAASAHPTSSSPAPSFAALPKGWIAAAGGPLPVQDSTGTRVGTKIVYWGGDNGTDVLPSYTTKGAVFDVARRRWSVMAASPLSDRTTAAAAGNDSTYFVWGGYAKGAGFYDDGAVYDVAGNSWRQLPPGPLGARPTLGAVWSGTEFVVVLDPEASSPISAAAYNPATNSWRPLPSLPSGPSFASLLLVSGRIVVFSPSVSYVLAADFSSWSAVASPVNIDPVTITFASEGDYAYVVGRAGPNRTPTAQPLSFQRFSFAAGVWDVRPAPPVTEVECPPILAMTTKEVFLGYCGGNAVFNRAGQFWSSASDIGKGRPVAVGTDLVFFSPGEARTLIYTGP